MTATARNDTRAEDGSPSWLIIGTIGVVQAFVAYLMLVGVPLTIVHLGGTAVVVGLSFTAWAAGRSVMGYFAGVSYDRVGARTGLVVGFLIFACAGTLYGLAATPWLLVAARLCQGIGAGIYWAAILAVAGGRQSGRVRVRRLSLFSGLVAAGGIMGSVAGGWMMAAGMARLMELAVTLSLLLAALAAWKIPSRVAGSAPVSLLPIRRLAGSTVGALSGLAAVSQLPLLLATAGLPLLLLSVGLGAGAIGVENALIVAAALLGQFVLFRFSTWAASRRALYALYAVAGTALAALAVSRAPMVIMVALAAIGMAAQLLATLWTSAVQSAAPSSHIGGATGFMRASSDLLTAATYPMVGLAEAYLPEAAITMILIMGGSAGLVAISKLTVWSGAAPSVGAAPAAPVARDADAPPAPVRVPSE